MLNIIGFSCLNACKNIGVNLKFHVSNTFCTNSHMGRIPRPPSLWALAFGNRRPPQALQMHRPPARQDSLSPHVVGLGLLGPAVPCKNSIATDRNLGRTPGPLS